MDTKHTPGPWYATNQFADKSIKCNCAYILSECYAGSVCDLTVDNGKHIVDGGNDGPSLEEAAANGHLISAAPELLEWLEHAVTLWADRSTDEVQQMWLRESRAAIAKAIGKDA